jgi:pyruvate/2-oxoglutarate dehydrogenase complex dihydrolipoamide acyltransferase (E2) component
LLPVTPLPRGDILCEVETDKATMEVESTAGGTVLRLLAEAGDTVPVKTPIVVVGNEGEDISPFWRTPSMRAPQLRRQIRGPTLREPPVRRSHRCVGSHRCRVGGDRSRRRRAHGTLHRSR